ncbi:MAG: hypothetical protein K2N21_02930 [Rikenellaceae bacterium]|nr:hypothetical protein [Rikenellaceae bacterium]
MKNNKKFISSVEVVRDTIADTMLRIAQTDPIDVKTLKEMAAVLKEVDKVVRDHHEEPDTDKGVDFLVHLGNDGLILKDLEDEKKNNN